MAASPQKIMRLTLQIVLALLIVAIVAAVMLYLRVGDTEAALAQEKQNAYDTAASGKKIADELRALKAKSAEQEKKLAAAEQLRASLQRIEPQLTPILEAAAGAKGAKPEVKANALAAAGIVGQAVHGADNDAALALLDRALAQDKANCAAGLAMNLSVAKKAELGAECAPTPVTAAADAKSAAAPAPSAAPAAAPAASAVPAAKAAAKN